MLESFTPQGIAVQSANAGLKFAGYGTILFIADEWVPGLFLSVWPLLFTVLVLTVVGVIGDAVVLPRLGNGKSLSLGVFGMVAILWLVPRFWPASHMTFTRAVVLAVCLVPLEFALHRWILRTLYARAD